MAFSKSRSTDPPRRRRLGIRLLASAAVLTVASGAWSAATWSALSDSSVTPANSVTAGSVDLSDNDSGGGLLALGTARPNDVVTGCIRVTYSGSAPARVRVFGATGGTGRHLVEQSLAQGHAVTAFVRDPAKLGTAHANLTVVQGDAMDALAPVVAKLAGS